MSVILKNIKIDYGKSVAVKDFSMKVEEGELVSILGPSGCGKSTTLYSIAGLLNVSEGNIFINEKNVTHLEPKKRKIGLVFQNYSLYPHLTIFENIAFPLKNDKKIRHYIKRNNLFTNTQEKILKRSYLNSTRLTFQKNLYMELNNLFKEMIFDLAGEESLKTNKLIDKEINSRISKNFAAFSKKENIKVLTSSFFNFLSYKSKTWVSELYKDFVNLLTNEIEKQLKHLSNDVFSSEIMFIFKRLKKEWQNTFFKMAHEKRNNFEYIRKDYLKHFKKDLKKFISLNKLTIEEKESLKAIFEKDIIGKNPSIEIDYWHAKLGNYLLNLISKNVTNDQSKLSQMIDDLKIKNKIKDHLKPIDESKYKKMLSGIKSQYTNFKKELNSRVLNIAKKVEIENQLDKKPRELSGGQQQRVAIARAMVKEPKVLLLDEPLSNLDAKLRVSTREWIRKFQQELGVTTIFVTHDQEEAMSISDKIFIMKDGILQQADSPLNIYKNPKNKFVAEFIGNPTMNFVKANIKNDNVIHVDKEFKKTIPLKIKHKKVILGIRPENIDIILDKKDKLQNLLSGKVTFVEHLKTTVNLEIKWNDSLIKATIFNVNNNKLKIGDSVNFKFSNKKIFLFSAKDNKELMGVI